MLSVLRGFLFWGIVLCIPGRWWLDVLSRFGTVAFRVAFVIRTLAGLGALKEFEVCISGNHSSGFASFYYRDEA